MEEAAPVITTVEGVFRDFKRRQSALIKALTSDAQQFFQLCDPEKGENLCLFGLPNETWEVKPPADLVPPDLPEPTSGINIARDEMNKRDWLLMVAALSDSWLLAVAFFFCGLIGFDKNERNELFEMIDDRPTVYEHVEDDFSEVICGGCGGTNESVDTFWICCDVCEVWFHGVCVKITPAKAEHLKNFKCPGCTSNRLRPQ